MLPGFQWQDVAVDEEAAAHLADTLDKPLPVVRLLLARGFQEVEGIRTFLEPELKNSLSNPFHFPGVSGAADLIWSVLRSRQPILIYGDFDADGVLASVVLSRTLSALGGQADVFIPSRKEGYGLTIPAIERAFARQRRPPALLITVDCGVTSPREVAYLKERGVRVIITDHHEPSGVLPTADFIINPKLGNTPEGARHLCGAGVAFKLAHGLIEMGRKQGWYQGRNLCGELLVPVGLATVTDIVPLVNENRVLVWNALKHWRKFAGPGLSALFRRATNSPADNPSAYTFGYVLGPRINAAGRLDSIETAYDLLVTDNPDEADKLASKLEGLNGERKHIEAQVFMAVCHQCGLSHGAGAQFTEPAIVAGGEGGPEDAGGWHPGVLGIVASRLCELVTRPAAIVSFEPESGKGRGSVRAPQGYNALAALQHAAETLERLGGHNEAAGFLLKPGCFKRFKELFREGCHMQHPNGIPKQKLQVDGWLRASEISDGLYDAQQELEPFGHQHPPPRWGVRGIKLTSCREVGSDKTHLQMKFQHADCELPQGIWFRKARVRKSLDAHKGVFDLVFELRRERYQGSARLSLHVVDMAPVS